MEHPKTSWFKDTPLGTPFYGIEKNEHDMIMFDVTINVVEHNVDVLCFKHLAKIMVKAFISISNTGHPNDHRIIPWHENKRHMIFVYMVLSGIDNKE